jgi:hypothetical protein
MNRKELNKKLSTITAELIREKGYICFVDIFIKLGYLDFKDYELWRTKKIPYLEKVIKVNLMKINFIMRFVQKNSINGKLEQSRTEYKSWGKGKKDYLRFSKSGEENIEKLYATHFVKAKDHGAMIR